MRACHACGSDVEPGEVCPRCGERPYGVWPEADAVQSRLHALEESRATEPRFETFDDWRLDDARSDE